MNLCFVIFSSMTIVFTFNDSVHEWPTNVDCGNIVYSHSVIMEIKSFTAFTRDWFLVKQFRSLWRDESRWIRNNKSISRRAFYANSLSSNTHSITLSCVVFARFNILMKLNFETISCVKSQLRLFMNLNLRVFMFLQTSRKTDYKLIWCTFDVHFVRVTLKSQINV